MDGAGNVLLVQSYDDNPVGTRLHLVKRSPKGDQILWERLLSTVGIEDSNRYELAVSPAGDVFVFGNTTCSEAPMCTTLAKFSPDGDVEWTRHLSSQFDGLAVDAKGSAVLTSYDDMVKFDASGTQVFDRKFGPTGSGHLALGSPAIDPAGNIAVGMVAEGSVIIDGTAYGSPTGITLLASFAPDGSTRWIRTIGQNYFGSTVGVSAIGTVVMYLNDVTSAITWGRDTVQGHVLLVAEKDGTPRWARSVDVPEFALMAVDPSGEVVIASTLLARCDASYPRSVKVLTYDLAGDHLWDRLIPLAGCSSSDDRFGMQDFGAPIAIGPRHELVLGESLTGTVDFGPGTVTSTGKLNTVLFALANGAPPVASDHFDHDGALGSNWRIANGSWSDTGTAAYAGGDQNYAVWAAPAPMDSAVSAIVTPTQGRSVGVIARASDSSPEGSHYAALIGADGRVALVRSNDGTDTSLAIGPVIDGLTSSHRITLAVSGSAPVQLTVAVDGVEYLHATDASGLSSAGAAGIFDVDGGGVGFDDFWISALTPSPSGG